MSLPRSTVTAMACAVIVGWWLGSSPASPVNPNPPKPDRPLVNAVARLTRVVARLGLWVAMSAEAPPKQDANQRQLVHGAGPDGFPAVDHSEGW